MCAIVGLVAKDNVNQDIYDALTVLQHRGQDAAGIMTCDGERVTLRKGNGLVRDVIRAKHMLQLQGNMGIGHVRYPTAGSDSEAEAQPLYVNSPYGLSIVHNGNLINTEELKQTVIQKDMRHLNTESDSEVLLNVFAHELQQLGKVNLSPADIFKAVQGVHRRCQGAYAVIIMIAGHGIVGFRDPFAIRPIIYGVRNAQQGNEYMLASESVALNGLGFQVINDILPGEAVYIDKEGQLHKQQCVDKTQYSPCIFEHVYLARPDSVIDSILVYKIRLQLGIKLAERILQTFPDHDIDVVMPIPDTSRSAALSLAKRMNLPYREGFVKNRYIGRTFIMPGQTARKKSVRQKLNAIELEFYGKNVLLIDDSIVRGTTSKEIIQMARDAGAKKVYFASSAPEVRHPNVYGIDMPAAEELIAHGRETEAIAELIGADCLVYQDLSALYEVLREANPKITRFEDSIFTGDYITGGINEEYLYKLGNKRQDKVKQNVVALQEKQIVEIYNTENI